MHYGFLSGARSYYPDSPRENDPIIRNGQRVLDEKEYLTDAFAREAVDFIARNRKSGGSAPPFFVYFAFNAVHKPLDGVNLLPFLTGQRRDRPHGALFWRAGAKHAARLGDWKLVVDREGDPQVFHLREDVGEQHDLAPSNSAKLHELQAAFAEWEQGTEPAKWVRQDARNAGIGGSRKPDSASGAPGRRGAACARIAETFQAADKNGDGKLSRDEYPQHRVFADVDANGDGGSKDEVWGFFAPEYDGGVTGLKDYRYEPETSTGPGEVFVY